MPGDAAFARESARYLSEVYVPRLREALATLPAGDLWWRPHDGCIAFGTVLLHLEGNVRQWILAGLGGDDDRRDRASEFAATDGPSGDALMERLAGTVERAADLVRGMDGAALDRRLVIQGFETTARDAIYHVVEHFSWHTGQAVWIAKARAGAAHDLAFYDDAKLQAAGGGASDAAAD